MLVNRLARKEPPWHISSDELEKFGMESRSYSLHMVFAEPVLGSLIRLHRLRSKSSLTKKLFFKDDLLGSIRLTE